MGSQMEPILILGMPRSGSSMTAGIFAKHGVWTGTCRGPSQFNGKGFFENKAIKKIVIKMHGPIVTDGILGQPVKGFRAIIEAAIERDGYIEVPWLWKGSALYWPCFYEFKPTFILCRRPSQQIFDSCRASNMFGKELSDQRLVEIIDLHQKVMAAIAYNNGATEVFTDQVAQGDHASIVTALIECGIVPDSATIDDFVDPDLWHHR